jgi:chorismate synthase
LANIIFAVPGVKAVSFGSGFDAAGMRGSVHNDAFVVADGKLSTRTNYAGGILGGRTVGTEVWGHVAMKPASTLPGRTQDTVDLQAMAGTKLKETGRHDPCIAVRAVPVVQACLRLVLADFVLQARRDGLLPMPEANDLGEGRAKGTEKVAGRTASQE